MKIRIKLRILALSMISSLLVLLVFSFFQIKDLSNNISKNQKISTPLMIESLNFQKDVIQIQQFLTDISATRGQAGLDDGFDEAEIYYKDALDTLNNLPTYNVNKETVSKLKSDLDDYYNMGITMANAYIEDGTEIGNTYMEQFDPFAEQIQEEAEKLIENAKNDRNSMTRKINNTINRIQFVSITLSLLVLIVLVFSYIVIKKSVLDRLDSFVNRFKDIAEGDGNLTVKLDDSSKDELGEVSGYFNRFIERIHVMISLIKDISYETNESVQRTFVVTNELSSSIGEVAITTNDVADQTTAQTDTVRNVINNINKNNEQICIGVKNIAESVEFANTANQLTERGFESMSDTVASFEIMETDINSSRDEIRNLASSVTEIASAIDIITNISYQINLLSLNASIEAARAGEHGKGFSVVSHEIGVLAEETKQATEKIADLILKVQSDTEKAVDSMDTNVKSINSQREVLNQGSYAIEETKKINALNSKKVEEVSNIFRDIENRLDDLSIFCKDMLDGADSNQRSSEEVASSIEEQLSALEEVSIQMENIKTSSNNLDLKLNEFII